MTGESVFDMEMAAAMRVLELARVRMAQAWRAYGTADRDLERRLRDALARVWFLEEQAVAALLVA